MTWSLTQVLWYASTLLEALICFRLVYSRAWRVFPRFTLFTGALACESVVLMVTLARSNDLYGNVWTVSRLVVLLFEVLAVIEVFSRYAESFPGIERVGKKLFLTLFCGGLATAAATLAFDKKWSGWRMATNITTVVNHQVHLWLTVFLLLTLLFFAYYGAPVAANLRRHSLIMLAFLSTAAGSYMIATRIHNIRLSNLVLQSLPMVCLCVWLFAFRQGQQVRKRPTVTPRKIRELRATEALNARLLVLDQRITLRTLLGLAPKMRSSGD